MYSLKILLANALFIFLFASVSLAGSPYERPAKPIEVPTSIPSVIDSVAYVAGLPDYRLDYTMVPIKLRLDEDRFSITRPKTEKVGKGSKIIDVEMCGANYKNIKGIWTGDEAIIIVEEGALPTLQKFWRLRDGTQVSLTDYFLIKKDVRSPLVIHFVSDEGQDLSVALKLHREKAEAVKSLIQSRMSPAATIKKKQAR